MIKEVIRLGKQAKCPHCGSKNVYGISRVVGYFSRIDNWNASKTAEFKDRQKGSYGLSDSGGPEKAELKKEVMHS
ncbi:hypothetical protein GF351_03560 [Candidatus Woesearchaeota archaeon]|nr:hypothetical protein [Candidatus Woesearchaeota archaeon]